MTNNSSDCCERGRRFVLYKAKQEEARLSLGKERDFHISMETDFVKKV